MPVAASPYPACVTTSVEDHDTSIIRVAACFTTQMTVPYSVFRWRRDRT
ncbi:hypothetical protein KCP78_25045 [Salmonella enterica subsp. enterica]|nr:hypothetical protein KCP78_25045 [Salmonella enterica subsp. enterica]